MALYNAEDSPGEGFLVTTTNSPNFNGGTVTGGNWVSASAWQGNWGYRIGTSGAPTTIRLMRSAAAAAAAAAGNTSRTRWHFRLNSYPPVSHQLFRFTNNGGLAPSHIVLNSNGTISLVNAAGTTVFTSTYVLPLNTWLRLEWNVAPSTTAGAFGKTMLWCGPATAAPVATNASTQAYFYSTAFDASNGGIGYHMIGHLESTSWDVLLDFDEVTVDSGTFTNVTTTWLGRVSVTFTAVWSAVATAALAIPTSTILPTRVSVLSMSAQSAFTDGGAIAQNSVVPLGAGTSLIVLADVQHSASVLPAGALSSMVVGPLPSHLFALQAASAGQMFVAGFDNLLSVLSTSSISSLSLSGFRTTSSGLIVASGSSALFVSPTLSIQSGLVMGSASNMVIVVTPGSSSVLPLSGIAALSLSGRKDVNTVVPLTALAGLIVAGRQDVAAVLALRGSPSMTVGPSIARQIVAALAATSGLSVGGFRTTTAVLVARGISAFTILARVIGDIHPYDNVLVSILDGSVDAVVLSTGTLTALLGDGRFSSPVLDASADAVVFPSGMIAVIQD
jgi:hypothetical protein